MMLDTSRRFRYRILHYPKINYRFILYRNESLSDHRIIFPVLFWILDSPILYPKEQLTNEEMLLKS